MTEYTAVTDWTTITTGQKVRATRDGEHLEFTVNTRATASGVTLRSSQSIVQICTYDRPEWVLEVEKVAVVLPTEPGAYTDSDGDLWRCNGVLWDLVGSTGGWVMAGHILAPALPFTRLRPEAEVVAEFASDLLEFFQRPGGGLTTHENDVRLVLAKWAKK